MNRLYKDYVIQKTQDLAGKEEWRIYKNEATLAPHIYIAQDYQSACKWIDEEAWRRRATR